MTNPAISLRVARAASRSWRGTIAAIPIRPDGLCWAVVAMGLVYVWRAPVLVLADFFAPLRLGIVTTAIGLLAWYNVNDPMRRWNRLWELVPVRLVVALFVVALVGVPLGIYPGKALTFIRVTYLGLVLLMFLTIASIRSRADLERLMLVHVIGATVVSLLLSRQLVRPNGRVASLAAFDANDSAMLLVCTIPLAVYFLRTHAKVLLRALVGLALVLFVIVLVRTGSRGGFLGFIATMLYLLFRFKGIPVRIRVTAITLGLVTLSLAGTDKYWAMMETIRNPEEDYNYTEAGGRLAIWKRGFGYMKDHPIAGVGLNNFGAAEGSSELNRARGREGKGWIAAAPHNSFLQMGAETGFPGLALFLALIIVSLRACSWRAPPDATQADKDEQAIARALAGCLVGFCVAGFFLTQAYSPFLYSLLGLIAGLIKLRKFSPLRDPAPVAAPRPVRGAPRARIARRRG